MPYLSALEVCSRQGAIQIHFYLTLPRHSWCIGKTRSKWLKSRFESLPWKRQDIYYVLRWMSRVYCHSADRHDTHCTRHRHHPSVSLTATAKQRQLKATTKHKTLHEFHTCSLWRFLGRGGHWKHDKFRGRRSVCVSERGIDKLFAFFTFVFIQLIYTNVVNCFSKYWYTKHSFPKSA